MWAPVAAAGVAVEQVPQLEAAAVDPGHHRPDRRPHDACDLPIGETFQFPGQGGGGSPRIITVPGQRLVGDQH